MGMELKHAILGLLSIQPMSGYDLNRAFSNTVAHFWYADQSQIYRTLDKLTANKAITTKVIHQEGKPDRKVHSLTTTGRAETGSPRPLNKNGLKSLLWRGYFSPQILRTPK